MHYQTATILTSFLMVAAASAGPASAEDLESFTEPYRRVAVSSAEVGLISKTLVAEGDAVSEQQILAQLDDRVLTASLQVARAAKDALGARNGAEVELKSKTDQLKSYRDLRQHGNATQRELERAESDQIQSQSRLLAVQEDLEVRRLEYERVKAQIQQRRIVSPINGFVVQIDKQVGEFVSPNDPIVMHVVQLDTLKSVFSVPMAAAKNLKANQSVKLKVGQERQAVSGVIEFVSPVADPQSATVKVKIRIPNSDAEIASGDICRWDLGIRTPPKQITRRDVKKPR